MELTTLEMEQAYLKAGMLGFAGSGKTFTAMNIATGLHDYIKSTKPIAFISTEPGIDFIINDIKALGKSIVGGRSKAFIDLMSLCRKAEKTADILIIDSISHFYEELIKAYQQKSGRQRMRVQDWAPIKQEWAQFTDFFLNAKIHIIMCGRAAWEYDFKEDDEGVTEITKTGTKMRTEKELGYEPSLLIEMERARDDSGAIGQAFRHKAWVLKDRFNQINGKSFDFETKNGVFLIPKVFESFLPHISRLNLGGNHANVDVKASSKDLFINPESKSNIFKRKEIALELIQNEITKRIPGRAAKDSQDKILLLEKVFKTNSWTAISDMHPDKLEVGLKEIQTMKTEEEKPNA